MQGRGFAVSFYAYKETKNQWHEIRSVRRCALGSSYRVEWGGHVVVLFMVSRKKGSKGTKVWCCCGRQEEGKSGQAGRGKVWGGKKLRGDWLQGFRAGRKGV